MKIKKYLIGARKLEFVTKEGNQISGTQLFVTDIDVKNSADGRVPEKIFINDLVAFDNVSKSIDKASRDTLIPVELDVTFSGKYVKYTGVKPI